MATQHGTLTWIIKRFIGFEALYVFGSTCSSIPPCGVALLALEADAVAAALIVLVIIEVTVVVAILRQRGTPDQWRRGANRVAPEMAIRCNSFASIANQSRLNAEL
ncbi:hypothetical protein BKA67DRAFT_394375 [Truncatella angustata]|uniref:Uncharacterized protein n=1 Tax=Truncatella angustata TaxID=152316 RepID=A0A9P8UAR7_9PEZI|nr:uncharacterized protein BKA67DRAFT_394375 [Truncatella angustata]KAH6647646.1 hypothetical protein BKA67DRAFT_394375 [Truncatella angustata]